jgi:hypothetical protein
MLKSREVRDEAARRKAQDQFAKVKQRDAEALKDREKVHAAEAAKTARLRALRLAKEAIDKEAADKEATEKAAVAAAKPAAVRRKRASTAAAKVVSEADDE